MISVAIGATLTSVLAFAAIVALVVVFAAVAADD
jgi:hypothetical protein